MWALSAQLSLAQSDKAINLAVSLPTCIDEFASEHEFYGSLSLSHIFPLLFFGSIFLFKTTTTTITSEE